MLSRTYSRDAAERRTVRKKPLGGRPSNLKAVTRLNVINWQQDYITPAAGSQEKGTEYHEKHSECNRHCYSCSRIIRRLDRLRCHRLSLCVLVEHSGYCRRSDHVRGWGSYGRRIPLIYFLEARASCSGFQNISTRSRLLPTLPSFQPRIKPWSFQ